MNKITRVGVYIVLIFSFFGIFATHTYAADPSDPTLPSGCYRVPSSTVMISCAPNEIDCGGRVCCSGDRKKCLQALGITCSNGNLKTALGCLPFDSQNSLVSFIFKAVVGIAGGISLLLIINATVIIMTSKGDPKRLQGGKEVLNSAIAGLMLIIFGVFILRFLGSTLFGIF